MNVRVPGLALLLVCVVCDLGRACTLDGITMICQEVPSTFSAGYSSVVMILKDVGEINSTAFHSDSLASITRLTINRANVTGMAAGALGSFRKLQNLTLDQNGLARVDAAWFDRPAALKALSLAENRIEVLDGPMFSRFTGLTLLNLAKNRIRAIDAGSFVLQSSLAHLDLSGNRLTRVDPEALRPLSSTSMRLDGNPWNCACGVEDFADFLKDLRSRSLLEREMEVTCMSPASLLGQPVWNVSACGTSTTTTSPPPAEMTLQPKPTEMFTLQLKPAGKSITVPTLIGVIVALCVLLCVTCFLGVLYRRKRKRESVKPGPLNEEEKEDADEDNVAKYPKTPAERKELYDPTRWNSEIAWRTPVTGARAKSANAVLLTSPACTTVKDQLTVEAKTESPSQNSENTAEGNGKLGTEAGEVGIRQKENAELTNEAIQNNEKDDTDIVRWEDDARAIPCVSVNIDPVPYLSIGTGDPSKPNLQDPVKGQHDGTAGHQLQMRKVMARVSTWPPTSAQWQARCSATDQQEKLSIFAIHTPNRPLRAELTGQAEHFENQEFGDEMQQVACARDVTSGNTSSQSSGVGAVESSSASEIIPDTDRAHVVEDTRVPDLPDLVSAVSDQSMVPLPPETNELPAPDQSMVPPETNELPASDQSMVPPETNELPASDQSMVPPETNELAREWRQSQSLTATSDTDCQEEIAAVEDESSKLSDEDVNPRSPGSLSAEVQSEGPSESQSSLNEDEEENEGSAAKVTPEEGAAEMTEGFENHGTCESDQGVLVNEQSYEQEQVQQMGPGSSRQSAGQGSFSSTAPSGGVSPGVDNQYACMDLLHEVVHNHGRWTRHRWKQTHLNQQRYKHQAGPNPGLWWP